MDHRERIFKKIKKEWEKRVGKGNIDEPSLRRIIIMADTDNNGKKKVTIDGITYLVPIEDIILDGIKGTDIEKYPLYPVVKVKD